MKRAFPFFLFLFAIPLWAADGDQSYISYDDGQSVVRQGIDGREVEARVNLPIFAGDQVVTGRRGRTEIRLADGSVIAIDRESALEITSIGNTFESQDERSVATLRSGAAIIHMQADDDAAMRLDTPAASYASLTAGIYSVEVDPRGRDQVTVLSGATEVRTQQRTYRLRAGETARVGPDGIYDIQSVSGAESSFERWYLNRVDRYQGRRARYLDSRYSWVEADLADHGDWVYVGEFGWVWRPYVVAGWRPYYHGSWSWGPRGHMIWSSYEPWGWYPYHYGRWSYSGIYGWVWLPGYRYSPAWVYWAYGPSWVGWAPAGWYDCYRPYNWIWNGYGSGRIVDVGFFGRINLAGADLSGWTILESGTVVSTRVDRAALSLDAARARMARDGGQGIFSSAPVRLTREDLRNPAAAVGRVSRLGVGGGTGKEGSGSLTDLTSFFRRDPELSPAVRSALDRSKITDAARRMVVPTPSPDRSTSLAPAGSLGRAAGRAGSGDDGRARGRGAAGSTGGRVDRGDGTLSQPRQGTIIRSTPAGQSPAPSGRVERGTAETPRSDAPRSRIITRDSGDGAVRRALPAETPKAPESAQRSDRGSDQAWRGRVIRSESPAPAREAETSAPRASEPAAPREIQPPLQRDFDRSDNADWRSRSTYRSRERSSSGRSDSTGRDATSIPRQVIDSIGGARIVPNRDSGRSSRGESAGRIGAPRGSGSSGRSAAPPRSGGSSGGSVSRPAPSAPSPSPPARSSAAPSRSDGGSRSNIRKD